jgi:hypothetical protein
MIKTFVIIVTFLDFDDCWNWAHKNNVTRAEAVCTAIMLPPKSLAPTTSLRPKARPTK